MIRRRVIFYTNGVSGAPKTPTMVHRSERRRYYLEGKSFAQQSSENEHEQVRQPFTRQKRRKLQGSDSQTCVKKKEEEACSAMATWTSSCPENKRLYTLSSDVDLHYYPVLGEGLWIRVIVILLGSELLACLSLSINVLATLPEMQC